VQPRRVHPLLARDALGYRARLHYASPPGPDMSPIWPRRHNVVVGLGDERQTRVSGHCSSNRAARRWLAWTRRCAGVPLDGSRNVDPGSRDDALCLRLASARRFAARGPDVARRRQKECHRHAFPMERRLRSLCSFTNEETASPRRGACACLRTVAVASGRREADGGSGGVVLSKAGSALEAAGVSVRAAEPAWAWGEAAAHLDQSTPVFVADRAVLGCGHPPSVRETSRTDGG
jgi:hypothetical protein